MNSNEFKIKPTERLLRSRPRPQQHKRVHEEDSYSLYPSRFSQACFYSHLQIFSSGRCSRGTRDSNQVFRHETACTYMQNQVEGREEDQSQALPFPLWEKELREEAPFAPFSLFLLFPTPKDFSFKIAFSTSHIQCVLKQLIFTGLLVGGTRALT